MAQAKHMTTDYESALIRAMVHRCGLEDPDEFAAKTLGPAEIECGPPGSRGFTVRQDKTGTGRTTAMLLRALVALEAGCSVEIVAKEPRHAIALRASLHRLVEAWERPPDLSRVGFLTIHDDLSARFADVRLVDHSVEGAS